MMKRILALSAMCVLLGAGLAQADTKPVQLALWETIQLVPAEDSIKGLRLEVYGVNDNVMGVSLGFAHKSTGNTSGLEYGLVSITEGEFHGWQGSWAYSSSTGKVIGLQGAIVTMAGADFTGLQNGLVAVTEGNFKGLQGGLVAITKGNYSGWQGGWINWTEGKYIGLQTGLVNINKADFSGVGLGGFNKVEGVLKGAQLGVVNCTGETQGLQLGFINHTKMLNGGLQVGLGNINENKEPFGFLPFVNWNF